MAEAFRCLQLKNYHHLFLKHNKRADSRTLDQFRETDVTIAPVETADGSCCVRFGNSCVMCGTKLLIQTPEPANPDDGILDISVKLPPNSLHKYKWNKDAYADQEQVMAERMRQVILSSQCFDLKQLVIQSGKHVWQIELEVICLDFDGNIFDVALTALVGCLLSTNVPLIEPQEGGNHLFTFTGEKKPLELKSYPISCSFALMHEDKMIADPTVEEEILSDGMVNIVLNHPTKEVIRVYKDSGRPVSEEQIFDLVKISEERATRLFDMLHEPMS